MESLRAFFAATPTPPADPATVIGQWVSVAASIAGSLSVVIAVVGLVFQSRSVGRNQALAAEIDLIARALPGLSNTNATGTMAVLTARKSSALAARLAFPKASREGPLTAIGLAALFGVYSVALIASVPPGLAGFHVWHQPWFVPPFEVVVLLSLLYAPAIFFYGVVETQLRRADWLARSESLWLAYRTRVDAHVSLALARTYTAITAIVLALGITLILVVGYYPGSFAFPALISISASSLVAALALTYFADRYWTRHIRRLLARSFAELRSIPMEIIGLRNYAPIHWVFSAIYPQNELSARGMLRHLLSFRRTQ